MTIISVFYFEIQHIDGDKNSLPDFLTREFLQGKMTSKRSQKNQKGYHLADDYEMKFQTICASSSSTRIPLSNKFEFPQITYAQTTQKHSPSTSQNQTSPSTSQKNGDSKPAYFTKTPIEVCFLQNLKKPKALKLFKT